MLFRELGQEGIPLRDGLPVLKERARFGDQKLPKRRALLETKIRNLFDKRRGGGSGEKGGG